MSPILYAVIAYGVLRPTAEQVPALTGVGRTLYYAFEIVLYLACGVVAFLPGRILSPGEDRPVEGDAAVRRQTALNRLTMRMVVCDAIFESLGILGLLNIFLDRPTWMPGLLMLVSFILMVSLTPALRGRLGEIEGGGR
jgi:hypothetical protein